MQQSTLPKADYGLDAPGVMRNLALAGGGALLAGGILFALLNARTAILAWLLLIWGVVAGLSMLVTSGLMLRSSRVGKLQARTKIIQSLNLQGNETVLDVGCGRGLLLTEAAQRLPKGKAIGIDLWSTVDQSGNRPEATLTNARAEGVSERVEIRTGDMRQLPFEDGSIDAVVANFAIHNLPSPEDREQAIAEIDRVLKPAGAIAICDFTNTDLYLRKFQELGWQEIHLSSRMPELFPPSRLLTGTKPG